MSCISNHRQVYCSCCFLAAAASLMVLGGCTAGRPGGPIAAFRDSGGAVHLALYRSRVLRSAPGTFVGGPAVVVGPSGSLLVVARSPDYSIWMNVYRHDSRSWLGWKSAGGRFDGNPAATSDTRGGALVVARDLTGSYWVLRTGFSLDLQQWESVGGVFLSDPVVVSCDDGSMHLFGMGKTGELWTSRFLSERSAWQPWVPRGGVFRGKPGAACGTGGTVYVAARDQWGSVWLSLCDSSGWSAWSIGGGPFSSDPELVSVGRSVLLVATDGSSNTWICSVPNSLPKQLESCVAVGKGQGSVSPTVWQGEVFLAGTGPDRRLYWWSRYTNEWRRASRVELEVSALATVSSPNF